MPIKYHRPQYPHDAPNPDDDGSFEIKVRVELFRIIAYIWFYIMVIFAVAVTRLVTADILEEGVDKETVPQEQWGCGAFNRGVSSRLLASVDVLFVCSGAAAAEEHRDHAIDHRLVSIGFDNTHRVIFDSPCCVLAMIARIEVRFRVGGWI